MEPTIMRQPPLRLAIHAGRCLSLAAAVVGMATAVACVGDAVLLGGGDAGSPDGGDSGSQEDAADGSWSPVCPEAVPADGTPCSSVNLRCEYGTSAVVACNTIAYCELEPLRFTITTPDPSCPITPPTNPSDCPSTYAGITGGSVCTTNQEECGYPDGQCDCDSNLGSLTWTCVAQPAACPPSVPRFGAPCSTEGISCNYFSCDKGGAEAFCQGGVWNGGAGGCAAQANP
jgi:hypothetical protein